jgi:hypothetical protein
MAGDTENGKWPAAEGFNVRRGPRLHDGPLST